MASFGNDVQGIGDAAFGLGDALTAYQNNRNSVTAAALGDAVIGLSGAILSAAKDNPATSTLNSVGGLSTNINNYYRDKEEYTQAIQQQNFEDAAIAATKMAHDIAGATQGAAGLAALIGVEGAALAASRLTTAGAIITGAMVAGGFLYDQLKAAAESLNRLDQQFLNDSTSGTIRENLDFGRINFAPQQGRQNNPFPPTPNGSSPQGNPFTPPNNFSPPNASPPDQAPGPNVGPSPAPGPIGGINPTVVSSTLHNPTFGFPSNITTTITITTTFRLGGGVSLAPVSPGFGPVRAPVPSSQGSPVLAPGGGSGSGSGSGVGTSVPFNPAGNVPEPITTDPTTDPDLQTGVPDVPVVLDLSGKGINITQLSSSNTFFDTTGDGYKNQTAWAGVGNGVLFFDSTGQGQLTQANQINFTDWDPGASTDIQALEDVFDTNHDGSLDASDTDFSDFFVSVTNANGTHTTYSLAQLGITSINLNANATNVALPDGSSIDGETTFTITNPSTGVTTTHTAATVSFATSANGYVVATTETANADGSETIANVASNADGSLAYESVLNISANGLDKTLTQLNNGGVVTTIQTDDTVDNADGSTTETLTSYAGGAIQLDGELTSAGTAGTEKLNSTTITTSANGDVVTILRDQLGGGFTTQEEVDTTNADGSTSIVVSDLNFDGSTSSVTTTDVSAGGLARITTALVDGIAADSAVETDVTVVNGATRTETVTDSVGTTVTSLATTVTQTTANSVTQTIASDLADGTTLDRVSVAETVTNADGSTTITQTDTAADGTLLDETVTQQSADGLLKTTSTDTTGATAAGAPVFDTIVFDDTVVNSDGSRAETVTNDSQNGTLQSKTITTRAVSGPARTVTTYATGDGAVSQTEVVSVNATTGAVTDTLSNLNADGSLANETVTTTSANGLSRTVQVDTTGATANGSPVFDHTTTDVTVHNADGSTTETVTNYGATTSNLVSETVTTTSANGLTRTVESAFTASSLANGTFDAVTTDATVVNSDGSLTETITDEDGHGNVLDTTVKQTSADRRTVTTTTTLGTTGLVKTVETVVTQANGTVVDTVTNFDNNGDVLYATVTTISADGLTRTTQDDIQGQTASAFAANGLSFDQTTSDVTVINADGSRTETVDVTSNNGTLESQTITTTNANGLTLTTTNNPFATAHFASQTTDVTTFNSDGSSTETVSDRNFSGALIDQTVTTTSANGLSTTTTHNFDGAGVEQTTTDVTTINPNGSQTEVVTDYTGTTAGTVRDVTTTTSGIIVAGAGLETLITRQSNGSVPTYQVETILPNADGTVSDTTQYYSQPGGPLLKTVTTTTSANGLRKVVSTEIGSDTTPDFSTSDTTVLNPDGSQTETVANTNKAGLISEAVTTTSANGLSKTTSVDANGALNSSGAAVFNLVTTDNTVLNSNGSRTETIISSNANSAAIGETITTTSADQQTVTVNRQLNETGTFSTVDQTETTQTEASGAVIDTTVSYNASHAVVDTVTKTTSGNGLATTTTYVNGAGTTTDAEADTTTYDSNGDGGTLEDFEDTNIVNGTTLKSSVKTQRSANGQSLTTTTVLTGALVSALPTSVTVAELESIAISDDGSTTKTTSDFINGSTFAADITTVVTSADQRSIRTSTTLDGAASPYVTEVKTIALDGSTTDVTTYDNPADTSQLENEIDVVTSADGRTITTTAVSDLDSTGHYNVVADTYTVNADGTTTETRSGTGSFGAGAFKQIVSVVTNADASRITTTSNYDASGSLVGQIVADVSPDGLVKSFVYDTTGLEAIGNLDAAAADLIAGTTLPASLLPTDIIETDTTTLNSDGSKTEIVKSAFGNSFANLRSETISTTSANGLSTVTKVDNDGNGIFEQVATTTILPDGSKTEVIDYFNDKTDAATGSNTYTTSANGLVTTLTTSTGITDTKVTLPDANGSYQFSWNVAAGSVAASQGFASGSASHDIDANGIDTWTWDDGATGSSGTIRIDVATEKEDVAEANGIYMALLGRDMDDAETEYLAQFIDNGVLNRLALAESIVNATGGEYQTNYFLYLQYAFNFTINGAPQEVILTQRQNPPDVFASFENALGRLPTAEELGTFDQYFYLDLAPNSPDDGAAQEAVALAQYATDLDGTNNRTSIDPNQVLASRDPSWISPAASEVIVGAPGTYSETGKFLLQVGQATLVGNTATRTGTVFASGVAATIDGNNNVVELFPGGNLTINGYNNAIETFGASTFATTSGYSLNYSGSVTINASNASISLDSGSVATVSGNNDQIAQIGPTTLTLASGSGDEIFVAALPVGAFPTPLSNASTTASNASITIGPGVDNALVEGSNDVLTLTAGDDVTLTGTNDTVSVVGDDDTIAAVNVASGNDTLSASGTHDTLIARSGQETLTATGSGDVLIGPNGETLTFGGSSATLLSGGGKDTLIAGFGKAVFTNNGLTVNLANGTTTGGGVNGALVGITNVAVSGSNDTVTGDSGTDTLSASGSGDTLIAGSGSDTLTGTGSGDTLLGGSGNDTFVFNAGSASDTINNLHTDVKTDQVQFGAGITASDLAFGQDGNDLVISVAGSTGTLTIQDWFLGPSYQIGSFELANGTAVTPNDFVVQGSVQNNTLVARPGEHLLGGSENDTYVFNRGAGSNVIFDNATGTQTTTTTVEQAVFSSGSIYAPTYYNSIVPKYGINESNILGRSYASSASYATLTYLNVIGYAARPKTTTQTVQVSDGANTLLFGAGISASDLEVQASGNDLVVAVKDPNHPTATFAQLTDKITIQNWVNPLNQVQTFQFADGSTLNAAQIVGLVNAGGADTLTSASGVNTLVGGNGDAILLSASGSTGTLVSTSSGDVLSVTGSGNTLIAGTATDTLSGGSGNDTFVVTSADGTVIRNFQVGSDKIDLTSFANVVSLGNLSFVPVTVGGQASVTVDAGSTQLVTLVGVTAAQLSASNFVFHAVPGLSFAVQPAASGNAGSSIALPITAAVTDPTIVEGLSIQIAGVPGAATLSSGTRNADGSWTLTSAQLSNLTLTAPAGSFAGTAGLTVTASATEVSNGAPVSVSTNLAVTIAGTASVPMLTVQNASGNAGTAISLSIASTLTATDGTESLSILIAGVPNGATLSAGTRNANGSWTLTPAQLSNLTLTAPAGSFAGTANLTVSSTATETDGSHASTSASLAVAIAGVATAPTLSVQNASGNAGSAIALSIASALTATDGTESLSILITGVPSGATLSAGIRNTNGSWTLTPAQLGGLTLTALTGGFAGAANLTVTSTATETDGSQASTSANLPVTIAGVATAPTLSVQNASGNAGSAIALSIASTLTATDGTESLSILITSVPNGATLSAGTRNANGSWTLMPAQLSGLTLTTPAGSFAGTANLTVTSTATENDGSQASTSASLAVAIAGVATAPTLGVQNASGTIGTAILLPITSAPTATDGTESLSINIAGLPSGATLSAGTQNANGSWTLTAAQLSNLSVTVPSGNFNGNLTVTSTATETDGSRASTTANLALAVSSNLTLTTSGANVVLHGGAGNDTLSASGSGDTLIAGSGTDTLSASGSGDTLIGGSGNDTFVFGGGSNSDIINNLHTNAKTDVVQFGAGITASELTFTPNGNDLVISVAGSTGTLTIQDWFLGPSYQIGSFELSNGTAVTPNIVVVGSASHNTLVAGPGEHLLGGSENDTYVFNRGAGSNVIFDNATGTQTTTTTVEQEVFSSGSIEFPIYYNSIVPTYGINESRILGESDAGSYTYLNVIGYAARPQTTTQTIQVSNGTNTLLFGAGISANDLEVQASGNDLIVAVKDPNHPNATFAQLTDKITIQNWVNPLNRVQTFQFADGSTLSAAQIVGLVNAGGADTLTSASGVNTLVGGNGDAILLSASGSTGTLVSTSGGDTLSVTGSGTLIAGAETLFSGGGTDTLIAASGEAVFANSGVTVNLVNGTVTGSGVNGTLTGLTNVAVLGNNDTLIAGSGTDTLSASGSGDTLIGGSGNDTFVFGGGSNSDIINNLHTNVKTDVVQFGAGITASELTFTPNGNDLVISVAGSTGTLTIQDWFLGPTYQIGSFELSNGTAVTPNIQVVGSASHNTLVAGPGEHLLGGSENDTYVFNRGAGSNVIFDNATGTQTTTTTVEQEVFSSGNIYAPTYYNSIVPKYGINESNILGRSYFESANYVTVTYLNVIGYAARPKTTTQTIQVSNGANTLLFGAGISASDLEVQASGNDLVVAVKDPNHPNATFAQLTDKITIQNWVNPLNRLQTFQFADGSTLSAAQIVGLVDAGGADTLTSASGVNTLVGGNGDAILLSASGSSGTLVSASGGDVLSVTGSGSTLIAGTATDTLSTSGSGNTLAASTGAATLIDSGSHGFYQYGLGDGQATIVNGSSSNTSASNELDFGSGISDNRLWFLKSGNNLQIDVIGTSSQVTISNWFGSTGNQLQEITAGGLKIDSQISQLVQAMATYSANNPGFNPEATGQQIPNNSALQSAIAASWHS